MTTKEKYWKFSVIQEGIEVASGEAPTQLLAEREAAHYAMMYAQDGPVVVKVDAAESLPAELEPKVDICHYHNGPFQEECPLGGKCERVEDWGKPVESLPVEAKEKDTSYRRGAERLADEVDLLVQRGVISSRSAAADALLDFRDGRVKETKPTLSTPASKLPAPAEGEKSSVVISLGGEPEGGNTHSSEIETPHLDRVGQASAHTMRRTMLATESLPAQPEQDDPYACSFTASGEHAPSPQGDCIYCSCRGRDHKMRKPILAVEEKAAPSLPAEINLRRDAHPDYLFSLYMRMAKAHADEGWLGVTKVYVAEKEEMEKRFGYPPFQPDSSSSIPDGMPMQLVSNELIELRCEHGEPACGSNKIARELRLGANGRTQLEPSSLSRRLRSGGNRCITDHFGLTKKLQN